MLFAFQRLKPSLLFTLYTNAEQTDISSATLKLLRGVVESIKTQYNP